MRDALELVDLQRHRLRHAQHRQVAFNRHRRVAFELECLALVGNGRELLDVEHVLGLGVLVQLGMAEIERIGIDRDVCGAGLRSAIEVNRAAGLGELAAPDRNTHMIGFEARIGMARVDGVSRGESRNGAGCRERGGDVLQLHAILLR